MAAFTDKQIATASKNYDNQVGLFEELYNIFLISGHTYATLAAALNKTESETEEWLHAERDLTLKELADLATQLGVIIEYEVITEKNVDLPVKPRRKFREEK